MRIVGGQFRGRALATPPDTSGTRPTSDRVREAVFNILVHGADARSLDGVKVLDIFAGTGALGCEAISRGAAYCLFVETDADARGVIRDNIEAFGLTGITKIYRRDATDLGPTGRHGQFGLVFLDPPYGQGLGERALATALSEGWLEPDARVVLEERRDSIIKLPDGLIETDRRTWGDTQVVFARRG